MIVDDPAPMPLTALKPTLPGDRVLLRPPTRADAHAMAALLADPVLQRATGRASTTEAAEAVAPVATPEQLDWYASRGEHADRLDLVVVDRDTGVVVGEVVLDEWDPAARSARLHVRLAADVRGRGLGSEAARLLLHHGFDDLGLNRVGLAVHADDERAVRLGAQLGFVVEGTRREAFWFDGRPVDELVMALLRSDWTAHRGRPTDATVPPRPRSLT